MEEEYLGMIKIFGGNYAPERWTFCFGQLLPINRYSHLFAIIGTTYGGDGVTTFAVPDLRGRAVIGAGQGTGLSEVKLGEQLGEQNVTLTTNEIPSHSHELVATTSPGNTSYPSEAVLAQAVESDMEKMNIYTSDNEVSSILDHISIAPTGLSQAHNNSQPSLGMNYIICIDGLFPVRNR